MENDTWGNFANSFCIFTDIVQQVYHLSLEGLLLNTGPAGLITEQSTGLREILFAHNKVFAFTAIL